MVHRKTTYILHRNGKYFVFSSENAACEYLGVAKCSVASCFRKKSKCKGFDVIRGVSEIEIYNDKRLHKIWESMHERCEYKKHNYYKHYGGRGISACNEWSEYLPFAKWAFANGYTDKLTIDRIDVNGNYNPNNCRWVDMKTQQNNKRTNRVLTYNGKEYTLTQLAEFSGLKKSTLRERLNNGWNVNDAVLTPVRNRTCGYRPSIFSEEEPLAKECD